MFGKLLKLSAGLVLCLVAAPLWAEEQNEVKINPAASEALGELLAGNNRFAENKPQHPHTGEGWRNKLAQGQHPKAVVLGCADSRVPPELLFDQGFGDLFVIRTAGNVVDPDVIGSIEYATNELHTPLVIVLGHENCGAVTAALQAMTDRDPHCDREGAKSGEPQVEVEPLEPKALQPYDLDKLLAGIRPALENVPMDLPKGRRIESGVEANVRYSVRELRAVPNFQNRISGHRPAIIGAVYNLETGKVRVILE